MTASSAARKTLLLLFALGALACGGVFAQEAPPLGASGVSLYWNYPQTLIASGVSFPQAASGGGLGAVVWQEYSADGSRVSLSVRATSDGVHWTEHRGFAGPFPASGSEVQLFSIAIDGSARIYVAANVAPDLIAVYASSDEGTTFREIARITATTTTVAPRIFVNGANGLILFAAQGGPVEGGLSALSIRYSLSADGSRWEPFRPLVSDPELSLNFSPSFASSGGRDYAAFQVLRPGAQAVYQLYLETSLDGGESWSEGKHLAGFAAGLGAGGGDTTLYSDERPFLLADGGKLSIAWERTYQNGTPQIYYAQYDLDGDPAGDVERVSPATATSHDPEIVVYRGREYLFYFDDRAGDFNVFVSTFNGILWQDTDLSVMPGASLYDCPVVRGDDLDLFWYNQIGGSGRLVFENQVRSAPPPALYGVNFAAGGRSNLSDYAVGWNQPPDAAGIQGFGWSVDQREDASAPHVVSILPDDRGRGLEIRRDGRWYIHVATEDFAGNWSRTSTIALTRDTVPPGPVAFQAPKVDPGGYLLSNSATVKWTPPSDPHVEGYSYAVVNLSPDADAQLAAGLPGPPPPDRVLTASPEYSFANEDNGVWALTVKAIDDVGNAGPPATIDLRMDRYVPVTYVSDVVSTRDALGRVTLSIFGRGFAAGGTISEVILDRKGRAPYDYTYRAADHEFTVVSDRLIEGPTLEDVAEGSYRVGLVHPTRGLYFTEPVLALEPSGTVKFGNFAAKPEGVWRPLEGASFAISVNGILILLVLAFLAGMLVVSVQRIGRVVEEGRLLNAEIQALISGSPLQLTQRKERLAHMKRVGMGLRAKFAFLITGLVIIVVLLVSIPLGYFMVTTQEQNLADGLEKKTLVLLDSLVTGARTDLPDKNIIELGALPDLRTAMDEARFVTITGYGANDARNPNYVWASDDPNILKKINTDPFDPGISRIEDDLTPRVAKVQEEVDAAATRRVSDLSRELQTLGAQAAILATKDDPESARELSELQDRITATNEEVNKQLSSIGDREVGSIPAYNSNSLSRKIDSYTFYKPIIYRSNQDSLFYRGMIRLGISTDSILSQIQSSQRTLLLTAGVIALIAIGLGVLGALLLAHIIIVPIRRLVRGVEIIRDTADKEKLKSHLIDVRTRDELSDLADTINQMTSGLVAAAIASKDLTLGKDTQKMFTPLEQDPVTNRKLTTARDAGAHAEFFGYYEGAKGVSGDYFDFRKLDARHYAIIECDVAGKGVPASLIMVEVATIFIDYFRNWSAKVEGFHLEKLVYRINDLVEERGFKGRFAALLVAILNVETGDCYFCNAGYRYVHLFDAKTARMFAMTLPNAPAAGVFPSMMVEMQAGFKQILHRLLPGDCLLLFTDGVEEAKRHFRDLALSVVACAEPGLKEGELHDTHPFGADNEEFGIPRIEGIVNAVFARRRYELGKHHNAVSDERLAFDYSSCSGTVEEAVLAIVSAERVFRIYPDPAAGPNDLIMVDRNIAEFLKKHFVQYSLYFREPTPHPTLAEYVYFSHVKEDEQYDDLTILGVRKL